MSKTVWETPTPSTGFCREAMLQERPGREVLLVFEFEDATDDHIRTGELHFFDTVQHRTTYEFATSVEMAKAYDRLIELPDSTELREVLASTTSRGAGSDFRHYRIFFDSGPCFDFICGSFEFSVTERGKFFED